MPIVASRVASGPISPAIRSRISPAALLVKVKTTTVRGTPATRRRPVREHPGLAAPAPARIRRGPSTCSTAPAAAGRAARRWPGRRNRAVEADRVVGGHRGRGRGSRASPRLQRRLLHEPLPVSLPARRRRSTSRTRSTRRAGSARSHREQLVDAGHGIGLRCPVHPFASRRGRLRDEMVQLPGRNAPACPGLPVHLDATKVRPPSTWFRTAVPVTPESLTSRGRASERRVAGGWRRPPGIVAASARPAAGSAAPERRNGTSWLEDSRWIRREMGVGTRRRGWRRAASSSAKGRRNRGDEGRRQLGVELGPRRFHQRAEGFLRSHRLAIGPVVVIAVQASATARIRARPPPGRELLQVTAPVQRSGGDGRGDLGHCGTAPTSASPRATCLLTM